MGQDKAADGQGLSAKISEEANAEPLRPFGLDMKVLLSTEDTGGAFAALVCAHEPGEGPPPHFHTEQDEYFYVLEGSYELTTGDQSRTVGPGTMVFLPRGTVHSFKNTGTTQARMLDWSIPGGQERYFREIEAMSKGGAGFGPEMLAKVAEANKRHDTYFAK